jgi:hypothetical protein
MMAEYEHNDARDSARMLASRTLEGLRHLEKAPEHENAINNMYRLLQGFRSHRFYGYVEPVRPEGEQTLSSMQGSFDRNVGDLKAALEKAFRQAFDGREPGAAIDDIKVVLRAVAYPEPGLSPDPNEVLRTAEFFEVLLDNLDA